MWVGGSSIRKPGLNFVVRLIVVDFVVLNKVLKFAWNSLQGCSPCLITLKVGLDYPLILLFQLIAVPPFGLTLSRS